MSLERVQETYLSAEEETRAFMRRVYVFMSAGLAVTGLVAYWFGQRTDLMAEYLFTFSGKSVRLSGLYWVLIIGQLGLVFAFSAAIKKVSASVATGMLLLYAVINGITLAPIFLVYTHESIASVFFISAGTFAGMSAFGYLTKRDLSSMGSYLIMGVWGLFIAGMVNLFMQSSTLSFVSSIIGVLVFTLLTAYDTQKIKQLNVLGNHGTQEDTKEALHGALMLYLDFINLFLYLLRLLGSRR